ncbi:MAG: hypothetical protein Ct9H300mP14_12060 [Gammaproteobacteria bacterium]|nr:MAG: hypothetical protein Ct9H300mP14_12060 [Gammaproteobacteria bacterium]
MLTAVHVRSLIDAGNMKQAEKILRKAINRNWDGGLVRLYGHIRYESIDALLKQAENWRVTHADDPDLLITLARFQLELKARDKALLLLVEAARIGVSGETYMELGLLLESMGKVQRLCSVTGGDCRRAMPRRCQSHQAPLQSCYRLWRKAGSARSTGTVQHHLVVQNVCPELERVVEK